MKIDFECQGERGFGSLGEGQDAAHAMGAGAVDPEGDPPAGLRGRRHEDASDGYGNGRGNFKAPRLIAAAAVGVVLLSALAVHVAISGDGQHVSTASLGDVLSPKAADVAGLSGGSVATRKGEAAARLSMKKSAAAAAVPAGEHVEVATPAGNSHPGDGSKVMPTRKGAANLLNKVTMGKRAREMMAAQARRDAAETRLAEKAAAKESAGYASIFNDDGVQKASTVKLAELGKSNEELAKYSAIATSGVEQYRKDTAGEQAKAPHSFAHSHEGGNSGKLLDRYSKIAGSGIEDDDEQVKAVLAAAAGTDAAGRGQLTEAPKEAVHAPVAIVEAHAVAASTSKLAAAHHHASARQAHVEARKAKASGLAGVCNKCLKDTAIAAPARKQACQVCLGDKSMLAVSCSMCSQSSTSSLYQVGFESGHTGMIQGHACEKPCMKCDRCMADATVPCWTQCNGCESCVRDVLTAGGANITGGVISDKKHTEALAALTASREGCTTCSALDILDGIASLPTPRHLAQARVMQLTQVGSTVSSVPAASEESRMKVISARLRKAGRLAARLKESSVQSNVAQDVRELGMIQKSGVKVSPKLLAQMGKAADVVEKQLQSRRASLKAARLQKLAGNTTDTSAEASPAPAEPFEATPAPASAVNPVEVEASVEESAASETNSSSPTPTPAPAPAIVSAEDGPASENIAPSSSDGVVAAEPIVDSPLDEEAVRRFEREVAADQPKKLTSTLPLAWGESSKCPLPSLPIVRGALCTRGQEVDGTCQLVWGGLPEILGPLVSLVLSRQPQKSDGVINFDVSERTRKMGSTASSGAGQVMSKAWEGWRQEGVVDGDGRGHVNGRTLGYLRVTTPSAGVAPSITWKNKELQTISTSTRAGLFSWLRTWPEMRVKDCGGRSIGIITPKQSKIDHERQGATIMTFEHRGEKLFVLHGTIQLLAQEAYPGEHIHVWKPVGDVVKGRLVANMMRKDAGWDVEVEAGGALDPRAALAIVSMLEQAVRPPVPPPSPWWYPWSTATGGGMGDALYRSGRWLTDLLQGTFSSAPFNRPGMWEGLFMWALFLILFVSLLFCCANCCGLCGIAVYGSSTLRRGINFCCYPCFWCVGWGAQCWASCCSCCGFAKKEEEPDLEDGESGSEASGSSYQGSGRGSSYPQSVGSRTSGSRSSRVNQKGEDRKQFKPIWTSWGGDAEGADEPTPLWVNAMQSTSDAANSLAAGTAEGAAQLASFMQTQSQIMQQHLASEQARNVSENQSSLTEGRFVPGPDGNMVWVKPGEGGFKDVTMKTLKGGNSDDSFSNKLKSAAAVLDQVQNTRKKSFDALSNGSLTSRARSHLSLEEVQGEGIDGLIARAKKRSEMTYEGFSVSISRTASGDANVDIKRSGSGLSAKDLHDVAVHLDHDHKSDRVAISHVGSHLSESEHGSAKIHRQLPPLESNKASHARSLMGPPGDQTASSPGSHKEVSWDQVSEKLRHGAAKSEEVKEAVSQGGGHTSWPASDDKDASATPMRALKSPRQSIEGGQGPSLIARAPSAASAASKSSRVSISELMKEQARQKEEFEAKIKAKAAKSGGNGKKA